MNLHFPKPSTWAAMSIIAFAGCVGSPSLCGPIPDSGAVVVTVAVEHAGHRDVDDANGTLRVYRASDAATVFSDTIGLDRCVVVPLPERGAYAIGASLPAGGGSYHGTTEIQHDGTITHVHLRLSSFRVAG